MCDGIYDKNLITKRKRKKRKSLRPWKRLIVSEIGENPDANPKDHKQWQYTASASPEIGPSILLEISSSAMYGPMYCLRSKRNGQGLLPKWESRSKMGTFFIHWKLRLINNPKKKGGCASSFSTPWDNNDLDFYILALIMKNLS